MVDGEAGPYVAQFTIDMPEEDFGIASLALPSAGHQLVICDFFAVGPIMGKYSIRRKVVGTKGDQFKVVVRLVSQKAHLDARIFSKVQSV